jgi:hypothetical protein
LATPGTYTVQASRRVDGKTEALGQPQSLEVVAIIEPSLPRQDRDQVMAFQMRVGKLQRAVVGANSKLEETLSQLNEIKEVISNTRELDPELYDRAHAIVLKLLDLKEEFTGDRIRADRYQTSEISIIRRVQTALRGTLRQTYGPTQTHRDQYKLGAQQFKKASAALQKVLKSEYEPLLKELDKAGAPWTPGRRLPSGKAVDHPG